MMSKNKWLLAFGIAVVLVGVFLYVDRYIFGANNPVRISSQITYTNVVHYVPPNGPLPYSVVDGYCFTNSIAAPYREDAWRCSSGNSISDPCFEIPGSSELLCKPDPIDTSTSSTFIMRLTRPLPKATLPPGTPTNDWGWFIELSDGTICTPMTGTLPFSSGGDVAHYSCSSSMPGEDLIFNNFNASSTVWTAEVGSLSNSSVFPPPIETSTIIPIQTVWQ